MNYKLRVTEIFAHVGMTLDAQEMQTRYALAVEAVAEGLARSLAAMYPAKDGDEIAELVFESVREQMKDSRRRLAEAGIRTDG